MTGTCGPTSPTASDKPNPSWSSLKMFQGLRQPHPQGSTAFCTMSCQTWKDWATSQRQDSSQRQKLGHPTNANGGSSSGWPTPDVTQRPHEGNVRLLRKGMEQGMSKAEADAMLGRDISKPQGKLENWNTPLAGDGQTGFQQRPPHKKMQINLPTQVRNGQCHQDQSNMSGSHHGQLNPDWVETLMGYPIGWTESGR